MTDQADAILRRVMLAFEGMSATSAVIDRLRAAPAAGFTLFRALNVESQAQVRALTTSLQEAAGGGLLIAADQEAGQFIALGDGTTSFAGNMALGAVEDIGLTERVGRAIGTEARANRKPSMFLASSGSRSI